MDLSKHYTREHDERDLLILHLKDDRKLSDRQIARKLGISRGTVAGIYYRCMRASA